MPMIGPERIDVEWAYQQLAGGPDYTMCTLDGVLVASTTGGLYQIQAHFSDNEHFDKSRLNVPYEHADNFYPAGSLPEDSVFVVRTSALSRLMRTLANTEMVNADAKPLATKERNTLLTIIGVLATMAELETAARLLAIATKSKHRNTTFGHEVRGVPGRCRKQSWQRRRSGKPNLTGPSFDGGRLNNSFNCRVRPSTRP